VNEEIQGYTRRQCDTHPENYNLCQRDGLMELRVRDEPINCGKADGSAFEVDELPGEPHDPDCAEDWAFRGDGGSALRSYQVTSGRVMTKHALSFQYGYLEFAVLLPQHDRPQPESGLWPAVWTLGNGIDEGPCPGCYADGTGVSWPACGEIDIMEYRSPGRHMGYNVLWLDDATGHVDACSAWPDHINGPGNPSCRGEDGGTAFAGWGDFPHREWHTYALEWTATGLRFFIDGEERASFEITDDNAGEFRNPHFLIANLAAGGTLGGPFEVTDFSEAALYVDYVRLYKDGTGSVRTPDGSGDCSIIGAPGEAAAPSSGR
jgi:beta-glucanase (GH16 family)